ncbi:MAG: hypothetical protein VB089_03615 [Anaerolineaceae bacterium]|nr:hypothetical protein [Anaerolineaceae bacterium]
MDEPIVIQRFRSLHFPSWTVPIALLLLCIASFGLLAPWLGLYWDDWSQLLVPRLYSYGAYWTYFASDRPFSAWTHILLVPLLGGDPLHWQIFTLGLRWLTACAMWWSMSRLWPTARRQVTLAAFLFAIYPAFSQQPISVAYHQHWLQYLLFFVSLGTMILAAKRPRRAGLYLPLSLITLALHLSITEFFIGVETLRPLFLWFALDGVVTVKRERLRRVALLYLPYLLVFSIYVVWRLFLVQFPGQDPHSPELLQQLFSAPAAALAQFGRFAAMDVLFILVANWSRVFDLRLLDINQSMVLLSWLVGLAAAIGLAFYLSHLQEPDSQVESDAPHWRRQAALLGGLITLLGPAPIWITGHQLVNTVDFHTDRFALVAMLGVSLLCVALLDWAGRGPAHSAVLLSLLVGLAVGFHLRTANDYRWMWTQQERFYWQLYWRAPYIEPGTALISEDEFLPNQELFSSSSAINLLYPQPSQPQDLAYWMYTLLPRYSDGIPASGQIDYHTPLRIYTFSASTPDSLLIHYDPQKGGCYWILRPDDGDNPDLSELVRQALPFSNLERIRPQPIAGDYPPEAYFGSEPQHNWCYYFQKADLARQEEDWQAIAALGDEAAALGYSPTHPEANSTYEWIPFIQGYARAGRWDTASQLLIAVYQRDNKYGNYLCKTWSGLYHQAESDPAAQAGSAAVSAALGCSY